MTDASGVFVWPQPDVARIRVGEPNITAVEKGFVRECLAEDWLTHLSPWNQRFESSLSDRLGQPTIATNSGSSALLLALIAAGVKPGDEVIVPSLTFAAVASAVVHAGAEPVFCDIDASSWTLSVDSVKDALSPKTRAIIVVHSFGCSANMTDLLSVSQRQGIALIEDACEAFGGTYRGVPLGTIGDFGTFSFYANKLITSGEGGAVSTSSADACSLMEMWRGQGMSRESGYPYYHEVPGYNFRLTAASAALGAGQMDRWETLVAARKGVEDRYNALLQDIMVRPEPSPGGIRAPWIFAARFRGSQERLAILVADELGKAGIETRPIFRPLHNMRAFSNYKSFVGDVTASIALSGLLLPTHHKLEEKDIEQIAGIVRDTVEKSA